MTEYLPGQLAMFRPPDDWRKRQAQQAADAPLKPSTAQQPCDVGLFSDVAAQADLIDTVK